jgi:carboxyl-terminal processing protease
MIVKNRIISIEQSPEYALKAVYLIEKFYNDSWLCQLFFCIKPGDFQMNTRKVSSFVNLLFILILCSCSPAVLSTPTPIPSTPTATTVPTNTLAPTATPVPTNTPVPSVTPVPTVSHAFDGYWMSETNVDVIDIHDLKGSWYHLTKVGCVGPYFPDSLVQEGSVTTYLGMKLNLEGEKLGVTLTDGPMHLSWSKLPDLPDLCQTGKALKTNDPVINFEVLWNIFQEEYPFFDVRKIDWQAQYDQFRTKVKTDMSDDELFGVMSDLLSPIQDAHVALGSPDGLFSFAAYPDKPEWSFNSSRELLVINKYLVGGSIKLSASGLLVYGKLNDSIGYLEVKAETGYTAVGDEAAAAAVEIDQAIENLGDVKAMIVDVRFNTGGLDSVSLALASRFTDQRRLAFSYALRKGDGYSTSNAAYLEPGGTRQFTKPVFLLTSEYTVSSAETFALAMRALPNVKIIGEKTRGCFGVGAFALPNGWLFLMPYFKVVAPDGIDYDGMGLPPDIEMAMSAALTDKDEILDKALSLAGEVQ